MSHRSIPRNAGRRKSIDMTEWKGNDFWKLKRGSETASRSSRGWVAKTSPIWRGPVAIPAPGKGSTSHDRLISSRERVEAREQWVFQLEIELPSLPPPNDTSPRQGSTHNQAQPPPCREKSDQTPL